VKNLIDLKTRTRDFAIRVIKLFSALPKSTVAQVIGKQLLRSGTSVGAHYREGMRARSNAEFISKLEGGLQELEESKYWMEIVVEAEIFPAKQMDKLMREADERQETEVIFLPGIFPRFHPSSFRLHPFLSFILQPSSFFPTNSTQRQANCQTETASRGRLKIRLLP